MRRDSSFGPPGDADNYLLRCLFDADGGDTFKAFHLYGALVSYNMWAGGSGSPMGVDQHDRPMPARIALTPLPASTSGMNFEPRLMERLDIAKLDKSRPVTLAASERAAFAPTQG